MTVPSNTIQTPGRIGNREDLDDMIWDISPTDTPFITAIGKGKATAVYHEWQEDTLVAANANNAAIQGDDVTNDDRPPTTRMGNYTQLMDKVVGTSSTQNAVQAAGRSKGEHAYQLSRAGKELKRDMEARATSFYYAVPPGGSTPSQTAGALAWLQTNVSRATTGTAGANPTLSATTSGYPNASPVNGTTRALAESMLKTVMQSCWANGADISIMLVNGSQKVAASAMAGIAQQRRETGNKKATIIGAADVYVSDFGDISFVPDRFCSSRDALLIDPDMWSIDTLQQFQRTSLAKTGHAERDMVFVEWALKCKNEKGSGVIADLS
jgi:hypothetical protein